MLGLLWFGASKLWSKENTMATAQLSAPLAEKRYTPDEFMQLRIEHAELVDGKVVEKMPAMFNHDKLVGIIFMSLFTFVRKHDLGDVAAGGSFLTGVDNVRGPDVSFISTEDLQGENLDNYIQKPPTLAVEVISKNDIYGDVDDKAAEFLRAGTQAVWIVNPRHRTVAVHTPDDEPFTYRIGDTIPGGEVLPGFELPVADIF